MPIKKLFLVLGLSILAFCAENLHAQSSEFPIHSNGFIYTEGAMNKLSIMVDSLEDVFAKCELKTSYEAKKQSQGSYFIMEKGNMKAAFEFLHSNPTWAEFSKKYKPQNAFEHLIIVAWTYVPYYQETPITRLDSYFEERSLEMDVKEFEKTQGNWYVQLHPKTEYSESYLEGFYIEQPFSSPPLPEKYAHWIQYSDCLVDTSTNIYFEHAQQENYEKVPKAVKKFLAMVERKRKDPPRPEIVDYDAENVAKWEENNQEWERWREEREQVTQKLFEQDHALNHSLHVAVQSALKENYSSGELEDYVAKYYNLETALKLKRSRLVYGSCSMDNSPRIHAMEIALYSAETTHWPTFLRAHLDILNDNFSRASDGSYAWGARETYLAELEALNIDIPELLLGISLRIENPAQNHYYGNIRRLGRAIVESKDKEYLLEHTIQAIQDPTLDPFNRILFYYLHRNYTWQLPEKEQKAELKKMQLIRKALPESFWKE